MASAQLSSSAPYACNPHVEWLFVNGAHEIYDDWLFANFVGFYKTFGQGSEHCQAFNAFPTNQYFAHNPYHNCIRYGFKSKTDGSPLAAFHRDELPFWTTLDSTASTPYQPILDHLGTSAKTRIAGDIVNIFLVARGYDDGDFNISGARLKLTALDTIFASFRDDVRINLYVKSCSGTSRCGQPVAWPSCDVSQHALDVFYSGYVHISAPHGKKLQVASVLAPSQPILSLPYIQLDNSGSPASISKALEILTTEAGFVESIAPPDRFDVGFV